MRSRPQEGGLACSPVTVCFWLAYTLSTAGSAASSAASLADIFAE